LANRRRPPADLEALLRAAQLVTHPKEDRQIPSKRREVPKAEKSTSKDSQKLQILYVEDDQNDQMILERFLEKSLGIDFNLVTTQTGIEGLERLKEIEFDLVLLDYKLPDMTGLEFLDEMRKGHFEVDVILITSQGSERIAVDAMKRGVRDYVTKDKIESEHLAVTIRDLALESALTRELNAETAKRIIALFSTQTALRSEVLAELHAEEGSKLSLRELINALKKMARTRSVLTCPSCGSVNSTPYMQCPECGSPQIVMEGTLEHTICGCIDFIGKFDKGEGELVCPSCKKRLEQIGVDYRSLESWFRCSSDHLFDRPVPSFRCAKCGEEFTIDAAKTKRLYWYQITQSEAPS